MRKPLPFINLIALLIIGYLALFNNNKKDRESFKEIDVERINIIGEDKNLYMSISNAERQALATIGGEPISPGTKRDLPGIIFFNRIGDEVGGIYYDGTDDESYAGITFDQQKNDQIMAIMKDEYIEDGEWKRWYGMFFRERTDSIRVETLFDKFTERTMTLSKEVKREEYLKFKQYLDSEINVYRMFMGRDIDKNTGLFIYDSKGKERIKIYVDKDDNTRLELLDKYGNPLTQ